MTGDLSREHWIVPVHGLTLADPDGTVQASARRDGTVILRLACRDRWTTMRLDVSRAAQLSTGIWEAAGAAQQLPEYLDDDQPPPPPSTGSGIRPLVRRMHSHRIPGPRPRWTELQDEDTPLIKVGLRLEYPSLVVEVWDGDRTSPYPLPGTYLDDPLAAVHERAQHWNWFPRGRGKVIWADSAYPRNATRTHYPNALRADSPIPPPMG